MQNHIPLWLLSGSLLLVTPVIADEQAQPSAPEPKAEAVPLMDNPKGPPKPKVVEKPELERIPDAKMLLADLSQAIVPLYEQLGSASQQLAQESQTFCQNPDVASFEKLRQTWGNAMLAWQRTDALLFGPAIEEQVDFSINFYPPKKLIINKLLKSETPLTPDILDQNGVGGQGLSTLEFLLFDRSQTAEQMLAKFTDKTSGAQRCAYIQSASQLLDRYIQTIVESWTKEKFSYAEAFRTAGQGSVMFTEPREPIETLINKLHQSAEKLAKIRLEKPFGLAKSAKNEPRDVMTNAYQLDAWRSGYALKIAKANAEGLQVLIDNGLATWLDKQGKQDVTEKLQASLKTLLALPEPKKDPFDLIEAKEYAELDAFYQPALQLHRDVKNLLAPAVGIQLGFNDNDGD